MSSNILYKKIFFIGGITLCLSIFFVMLLFSGESLYAKISSIRIQTPQTSGSIIPVRLKIPLIKVDAFLERVGLTVDGSVGVPKGGINAARYQLGPRPGEVGNAIIVGHYGTWKKSGKGSVFDRLHELKKGDKISVENASGVTISFVVTKMKIYLPTAIVPEVFTSTDGKSHLNLITCDGVWNKITKHYPSRLVVFTERE